ncbi:MAG TPA: membrane dipeptidase [Chryseosolibacter sp.]|nr:membrane dipeptidase [Chryseosolibacter sp.]
MLYSYVDLHCHPHLKPYGKSFAIERGKNSLNRKDKHSIWYYDSPNFFERVVQALCGICKFSQADCTTLANGNVRVVCASLYPIERGFFNNELGTGIVSDLAASFATSVGDARVDYIQRVNNYFEDLIAEYNYYLQGEHKTTKTDSGKFKYVLAKDFSTVEKHLESDEKTIIIILTIEGMHVVHSDYKNPTLDKAIANVREIKGWPHPPFFVTFAHHFNNHLCGHARSLFDIIGKHTNQSQNMDAPILEMGKKVLKELLSRDTGRRILVDIKHMSAAARRQYIQMVLDPNGEYAADQIPIVISHGAANGLRSMDEKVVDLKETGTTFMNEDINFYDEEIVALAKSKGIMGLQLDERRIADKETIKRLKHSKWISKIRHYRSSLLWTQVQHIAELLDNHDLFAWDCLAIGSDYDGIIDPLNGYLTQETIVHLEEYMERHAFNYMQTRGKARLKPYNQLPADEVVQRLFHSNAISFMRKHFW